MDLIWGIVKIWGIACLAFAVVYCALGYASTMSRRRDLAETRKRAEALRKLVRQGGVQ
jgi:hypothetical protein